VTQIDLAKQQISCNDLFYSRDNKAQDKKYYNEHLRRVINAHRTKKIQNAI